MRKLALSLPLAALVAAGCATYEAPAPTAPVTSGGAAPVTSASGAPVVSAGAAPSARASGSVAPVAAIRAGTGVVETVSAVPFMGSATAGASAPGSASRLAIRMSDGTVQYVDYEGRDITVGSRVELSSDGYIRKL